MSSLGPALDAKEKQTALSTTFDAKIAEAQETLARLTELVNSQLADAQAEVDRLTTIKTYIDTVPEVAATLDLLQRDKGE